MIKIILSLFSLVALVWSAPLWIEDPSEGGAYTGVVGIAEAHFPRHAQERVALMRAKAELADRVNIDIKNEMNVEKKQGKSGSTNNTHSSSKLSSNTGLRVEVKEKYTDAEGILYLWVIAN